MNLGAWLEGVPKVAGELLDVLVRVIYLSRELPMYQPKVVWLMVMTGHWLPSNFEIYLGTDLSRNRYIMCFTDS